MAFERDVRRRWFGGLMLAVALAMLVGGETVLKGRLSPLGFLFYWLACLVLTGVAMLAALSDARAQARRTLAEQRELFNETLKQIQTESKAKPKRPGPTDTRAKS